MTIEELTAAAEALTVNQRDALHMLGMNAGVSTLAPEGYPVQGSMRVAVQQLWGAGYIAALSTVDDVTTYTLTDLGRTLVNFVKGL